jgi:hypothetical protein
VATINVEGNYQQRADGVFKVDIIGTNENQFDALRVTDNVQLGGTLQIDASILTTFTPGVPMQVITAGSVVGEFEHVEAIVPDGLRLLLNYEGGGVSGEVGFDFGDLNGDTIKNDPEDFNLFVFALMTRDAGKFARKVKSTCPTIRTGRGCQAIHPTDGGDFDGDRHVDFSDIQGYQNMSASSGLASAALSAAFDRYFRNAPEPSSAALAVLGGILTCVVRVRRCGGGSRAMWFRSL